ncbi:MAG: hypothetical protein ACO2ZD_02955 [Pseudomonadales bacterium]|jgi:hypothetical protein
MNALPKWTILLLITTTCFVPSLRSEQSLSEREAMATLDRFMEAFNARDMQAWSDTLHYPHVRFASGDVTVLQSPQAFQNRQVFEALAASGWVRSRWVDRKISLSSPRKVHIQTTFERLNSKNERIGQYQSLYIVTQKDGRWGIQARSSLAP